MLTQVKRMSTFLGHFMLVFQIKEAGVQKGSLQGKTKSMKPYLILSSAIATMEKRTLCSIMS